MVTLSFDTYSWSSDSSDFSFSVSLVASHLGVNLQYCSTEFSLFSFLLSCVTPICIIISASRIRIKIDSFL